MKIIDNKKDYYDYLMGVYGMDEKIVYDRRGSVTYDSFVKQLPTGAEDAMKTAADEMTLKIGDIIYQFRRNKDTDYKWDMPKEIKTGWWRNITVTENPKRMDDEEIVHLGTGWKNHLEIPVVLNIKIPDVTSKKYIYPNGYEYYNKYIPYYIDNPILDGFGEIKKFLSPDTIWNNLYDYIAHKYDKMVEDTRTDIQHLESAGFDKKTSFRNVK